MSAIELYRQLTCNPSGCRERGKGKIEAFERQKGGSPERATFFLHGRSLDNSAVGGCTFPNGMHKRRCRR